jgi:predicted nucleic acid-binding protein
MSTFIDTSGFYAVLDRDDAFHADGDKIWRQLLATDEKLVTSNYILLETISLLQIRLGVTAARVFNNDVVPVLQVEWIDATMHTSAISAMLAASRRALSLVDCTSFEIMRRLSIQKAFTFDKHFKEQGFSLIKS